MDPSVKEIIETTLENTDREPTSVDANVKKGSVIIKFEEQHEKNHAP
jgi:hypothetical protein